MLSASVAQLEEPGRAIKCLLEHKCSCFIHVDVFCPTCIAANWVFKFPFLGRIRNRCCWFEEFAFHTGHVVYFAFYICHIDTLIDIRAFYITQYTHVFFLPLQRVGKSSGLLQGQTRHIFATIFCRLLSSEQSNRRPQGPSRTKRPTAVAVEGILLKITISNGETMENHHF